jgi:tetratricopeptide (TPR) repeat protein
MRALPVFFFAILSLVPSAIAQKPAGSGAGAGNGGSTVNGSAGTLSGNNPNLMGNVGTQQARPIFLSGDVLFDDGTSPNNQIRIERFCGMGAAHLETHTDSKGHFSFQIGGEQGANITEADSSSNTFGGRNGLSATASGVSPGRGQSLSGCELRAVYPGYVSERVDISSHHPLDDSKVGTLLLHRLSEVKGTTISVTTAEAPKSALKDFDKGVALVQKAKFEEAESRFAAATAEYPKYAEAWVALGETQQRLNKPEDAKESFLAAASADSHYVTPFDRLARLCAMQQNWPETAKYSKEAIDLNPFEFPSSLWYNALSNYNLKDAAETEKSARALIKIDPQHRYPDAETMLAEFAAKRGDLDEAATHIKNFLAEAPNAKNADLLRRQLAQIDTIRATQAKNAAAPVQR